MNDFKSQENSIAGTNFTNSNSIVAKFTFIILVFILFIVLCSLGTTMIGYFTQTSKSPYIIHGMQNKK